MVVSSALRVKQESTKAKRGDQAVNCVRLGRAKGSQARHSAYHAHQENLLAQLDIRLVPNAQQALHNRFLVK